MTSRGLVRFRVGTTQWAVPVEQVRVVRDAGGITPLPDPRPKVVGLLDHEERALPVVSALGEGGRHVLVLEAPGGEIALLVDEVMAVASMPEGGVGPPPSGQRHELVSGTLHLGPDLVLLLDAGALAVALA